MEPKHAVSLVVLYLQICASFCQDAVMYSRPEGDDGWSDDYCIFYNPDFHKLPHQKQLADTYKLVDLSSKFGCNASDFATVDGKGEDIAVIVARGECTFSEKAYNAQNVSAKAIIVASDQLISPGASNDTDYQIINITVATTLWQSVHDIQKMGSKVQVLLYEPDMGIKFDPNLALIFTIAVSCVIIGGFWAGKLKHKKYLRLVEKHIQKKLELPQDGAEDDDKDKEEDDDESVDVSIPVIIVFFFLVCTFIVLLYFFYDKLVYAVIGLFCLAGGMGMYNCLHPVWTYLVPIRARVPQNRIPFLRSRPEYRNIVFGLMCLGVGIWWLVERHAPYSWILQDILGYMFCINVMKSISIPNLKVCTIMLSLLFVYDVFFVFITPLLTSTGDSIMVKVATGGGSKTKETIPMAFRVPKLIPSVCPTQESLLGFGDIVIPGLLVCHNHAFDLKAGIRKLYFVAVVFAYSVGLVLTFAALYVMKSGQPALLYIVPCTLAITFLIGCVRGEVKKLWSGFYNITKSNDGNGKESVNQSPKPADSAANVSSDSGTDNESRELISR